jgi:hypothetical protein
VPVRPQERRKSLAWSRVHTARDPPARSPWAGREEGSGNQVLCGLSFLLLVERELVEVGRRAVAERARQSRIASSTVAGQQRSIVPSWQALQRAYASPLPLRPGWASMLRSRMYLGEIHFCGLHDTRAPTSRSSKIAP